MHPAVRLLGIVVLLTATFGAGVHYETAQPAHWPYPTNDDIADDYDSAVGERTLLFGQVQLVDPDENTARITVEHATSEIDMRVTNLDATVAPGGTIQVYGTLEPDYTIHAESTVVVNPDGFSTTYKYAVSVVGALLILAAFFREWRADRDELGFVPRGE